MKIRAWVFLLAASLIGCLSPKEKTAQQSQAAVAYPDKIFHLINQKKYTPEDFPNQYDFSKRFGKNEITALNLDTSQIDVNTYYFLSDQKFFAQEMKDGKAVLYYRLSYGEQVEKILRLQTGNSTKDIVLALISGDGMDSYRQSSEFLSDSILRTTFIFRENTRDDPDLVSYKVDSVTSEFLYDKNLNLHLLKRDTLRFTEESFYDRNYVLTKTSEGQKSRQFRVNNVPYFWNFTTSFHYEPGGKINPKPKYAEFIMRLTRVSDGEVVLADGDFKPTDQIDVIDLRADGFVDLNFDGYKDFCNYSNQNSGSGGAFFNAYIFNPETGRFDFSEELSGGELAADSVNKTLSTYWKMGVGWNHQKTIHFGTKDKVKFTEDVTREVIPTDTASFLITTYVKKIGDKIVTTTADTTKFEGY